MNEDLVQIIKLNGSTIVELDSANNSITVVVAATEIISLLVRNANTDVVKSKVRLQLPEIWNEFSTI